MKDNHRDEGRPLTIMAGTTTHAAEQPPACGLNTVKAPEEVWPEGSGLDPVTVAQIPEKKG